MQNVIPFSISFSVTDTVIWQVWQESYDREIDLSTISNPINTLQTIQTGILVPIGSKDQLAIEATLGFQALSGAFHKICTRDLNDITLTANNSLLKMESHTTPSGAQTPVVEGYFRVISKPQKLSQENWLYLYKIN